MWLEKYEFDFSKANWDKLVSISSSGVLGKMGNILAKGKVLHERIQLFAARLGKQKLQTREGKEESFSVLDAFSDFTAALKGAQAVDKEAPQLFATTRGAEKVKKVKQYKVTE